MAHNRSPLAALRSSLHIQLDPRAWPYRGLSPINLVLVCAILLATMAAIAETEPLLSGAFGDAFTALELAFGTLFAVEYGARIWSVAEDLRAGEPVWRRRLRFALSPSALFDLFAIAVTFAPFLGINALAFRLARLLRILRLAKQGRMSTALSLLPETVRIRHYEITVTLALALTVLALRRGASLRKCIHCL